MQNFEVIDEEVQINLDKVYECEYIPTLTDVQLNPPQFYIPRSSFLS